MKIRLEHKYLGISMIFLHFLLASPLNFLFGVGMVYLRDVRGAFFLFALSCLAQASTWSIYFLLEGNTQAKNTNLILFIVFLIFIFFSISLVITWKSSKGRIKRKKLGFKKNAIFILCSFFAYYGLSFMSATTPGFGYIGAFELPTASMSPTLLFGDYFLVTKVKQPDELSQGEVVVFYTSQKKDVAYVKRLIGLPGDSVQIISGVLSINDVPVKREIKSVAKVNYDNNETKFIVYEETLPNGHSHLIQERSDDDLLDNTHRYKIPDGYYFMLGDNRDNSRDSRLSSLGLVPAENIISKAKLIYYSRAEGPFLKWFFVKAIYEFIMAHEGIRISRIGMAVK